MRNFLMAFLAFLPVTLMAQGWQLVGFGGVANYQGDLQDRRFTTQQAQIALGLGIQYDINKYFSVRGMANYGRISADDRFNKDAGLRNRNLNFKSQILEGSIQAVFRFMDLETKKWSPYLVAGVGVFGFDPYTYDTLGNKFYLQPLGTEGQGLAAYPEREFYKRVQLVIPFGGGVMLRVNERITLGYEVGLRKTFTDYLDDVSTTYADPDQLLAARGPLALELAYRGDELKNGSANPNYPTGSVRGGPEFKDWYYFQGITVNFRLGSGGRSGYNGKSMGRQLDCPRNIY